MWCKHCKKQVSAPAADAAALCPDCGQPAGSRPKYVVHAAEPLGKPYFLAEDPVCPPAKERLVLGEFDFDTWELDLDLHEAERAMTAQRRRQEGGQERRAASAVPSDAVPAARTARRSARRRIDFGEIRQLTDGARRSEPSLPAPELSESPRRDTVLAWFCRAVGLALFGFGGMLLLFAQLMGRSDLWSLGLPLAIGGGGGWLMGHLLRPTARRAALDAYPHYAAPSLAGPHYRLAETADGEQRQLLIEMKRRLDHLTARLDD